MNAVFLKTHFLSFGKVGVRVSQIDKNRCLGSNPLKARNNLLHFRIWTARSGVRIRKWRFAPIKDRYKNR